MNKTKAARLPEKFAATYRHLQKIDAGEGSRWPNGMKALKAAVTRIANVAGTPRHKGQAETYRGAVAELIRRDPDAARSGIFADRAAYNAAGCVERTAACMARPDEEGAAPWPDRSELYTMPVQLDRFRCVGFLPGERILARAADLAAFRVWDIAAVQGFGGDAIVVGRVVRLAADSITVRNDARERTFARAEIEWAGRVDPEPIGRVDGPAEAARKRLRELRAKLDALAEEDDQIIRCSARYEIEKEIYDIEHPAADDWSAWEGE